MTDGPVSQLYTKSRRTLISCEYYFAAYKIPILWKVFALGTLYKANISIWSSLSIAGCNNNWQTFVS